MVNKQIGIIGLAKNEQVLVGDAAGWWRVGSRTRSDFGRDAIAPIALWSINFHAT